MLELAVLGVLHDAPMHGYELRKHLTGRLGAFRMGLEHGTYCLGCCWFLMALLFVGGVMNVLWIAALAIFVLAEKVIPVGRVVSRIAGVGMIVVGAWWVISSFQNW